MMLRGSVTAALSGAPLKASGLGRRGRVAAGPRDRRMLRVAAAAEGWVAEDNRRMVNAVYRVGDLGATVDYYKKHFGMECVRSGEDGAFLAYGPEATNFAVRVTEAGGVDLGKGFGHFGLVTDDVYKMCDGIKAEGGNVTREPGPVKGGRTNIAFVEDPTGYKWELIEREKPTEEPLCQVMLRVSDLDAAVAYYENVLGMTCLRRRENEQYKYTLAFMGFGPEADNAVIELTYNWGVDEPYEKGDAYEQVTIATDDVYKTAEAVRAAGGTVTHEPGPLPGTGTKVVGTVDPDGWRYVFVDSADLLAELA